MLFVRQFVFSISLLTLFLLSPSPVFGEAICINTNSTATSGSLTDSGGSGSNYSNNQDCGFLIQPSGGGDIVISFSQFRYENGYDYLRVYDGTSNSGTLLGSFTGSSLPSDLTATSGAMYIEHDSDYIITRSGFVATWSVSTSGPNNRLCTDTNSTDETGFLTDSGGSGGNYSNYESCGFLIQPGSGGSITLSFSSFNYENGYDYLRVYDGTSTSGPLLGTFTGSSLPSNVTASSGTMYIQHSSDYSITRSGFEASWTVDGGACLINSVADNFSTVSYGSQNGTENWTGNWIEESESDGVSSGRLRVNSDLCTSGNCLRLGIVSSGSPASYSGDSIYREADLSSADSATLSFNHRTGYLTGSQTVRLWVSGDGGSNWSLLKQFSISSFNSSATAESFDISAYAAANTRIRFESEGTSAVSGFYVDDISISYSECSGDLDYFSIAHDNSGLYCLSEPITVAAYDSSDSVLSDYTGTVVLDTQSGAGTWSLISGSGAFADTSADDGLAVYTYSDSDNGTASFSLSYTSGAAIINVDAYEGSIRDNDAEGDISFSATGFTLTASALANPPSVPINDPVDNQISAQAFNVHIAAYGTDPDDGTCGIIETYNGDKSISLTTNYINPTSGTLSSSGGGTISFTNGQGVINTRYDDVGQITLTATDSSLGLVGNTNQFIVKPDDFSISVSSGSSTNPGTTDSGSGFIEAGAAMTVDVQALNALGDPTPNYGNETTPESVSVSLESLVFPVGGSTGSLTNANSFGKVDTDTFQNTTLSWSEVGSMRLQAAVADGDYLGTGNVTSSASNTIGRFYPAGFNVGSAVVADACTAFTYLSQPALTIVYDLTAVNTLGAVTTNYTTGLLYPVGTVAYEVEHNNDGNNLSSRFITPSSVWSAGVYSVNTTTAELSRASSREAPLSAVQIGTSVSDTDGATINSPTMNASTTGDCLTGANCTATALGSASFYYGRVILPDTYGPETAPLPASFQTEYWTGNQFVLNTNDSCTLISRSDISFNTTPITTASNLSVNLSGGTTTAQFDNLTASDVSFASGDAGLIFSAPGINIANNSFTIDVDLNTMNWLRFDWDQNGDDNDDVALPTALIKFQSYRGHDRVIYWRQVLD